MGDHWRDQERITRLFNTAGGIPVPREDEVTLRADKGPLGEWDGMREDVSTLGTTLSGGRPLINSNRCHSPVC
jgi:hypothetical protein